MSIVCPQVDHRFTARGICAVMLTLAVLCASCAVSPSPSAERPNVIVIFSDDLGYADLGSYGADDIPTPNIDRMRREGVKFTDFYATGSSCMPSRAGLMTGSYAQRVDLPRNVHPHQDRGLNPAETTIASPLFFREVWCKRNFLTLGTVHYMKEESPWAIALHGGSF